MDKLKFLYIFLLIVFGILFLASDSQAATSVSQYGITWTFDRDYQTGQFANGDYWVVGPVNITSITPAFTGTVHGWQVNPMPSYQQGFHLGAGSFNPNFVPSLPHVAQPGQSIVKGISKNQWADNSSADCYPACLQTAAVLTVVASVPPGNGAAVFRPPYVGNEKPYYYVSALKTDLLPSLSPVGTPPSLDSIKQRFKYTQLDHTMGATSRNIRPADNLQDYQPNNAADLNQALMRLSLNDASSEKLEALIAVVQGGIDQYHMVKSGQTWPAGGGCEPGHKIWIAFTGVMLDNNDMKDAAVNRDYLEDHGVYYSNVAGMVLFGLPQNMGSEKTRKDPYEYIDGGNDPGGQYQFCCLSQPWKGHSFVTHVMPALRDLLNTDPDWQEILDYSDRWVSHGTWTLPDPYNRFPEKHGSNRDAGYRRSTLVDAMWPVYRGLSPTATPVPTPTSTPVPTPTATLTPTSTSKRGDLNNDTYVDVIDLGILLSNWNSTSRPAADINQDGNVDVIDLGILLSNWG